MELPAKNATPDSEIMMFADNEDRFVVTKDIDFYESKIINNTPMKLIIMSTGNITNKDLLQLIDKNLETIEKLTKEFTIVEIDKFTIKANK